MAGPKAIKGGRKRRLPRLSSAILPEGCPEPKFEPRAEDWQRIEEAYRHPLDVADQQEIGRLVSNYFDVQPYEPSAPFVGDVEKWLAKVHKTAEGFHKALGELEAESEGAEGEIERDAALHAKVLIELHLKFLRSIGDFRNATADFLAAAFHAKNKLKDDAGKGFVEGERWDKLVRGLAQWFEGKGLLVTASKGGNTSPFVAFMRELQKIFPERLRRHMHSDGALAEGIRKALIAAR